MKPADAKILSFLRRDARTRVPSIASTLSIPQSTVYEKLKKKLSRYIKKHVAILEFHKLGYHALVYITISCQYNHKKELQRYLTKHPNVNTLHKLNFGWDFIAECIFKDYAMVEDFKQELSQRFNTMQIETFNVVEELKKEAFLTEPEHIIGEGAKDE